MTINEPLSPENCQSMIDVRAGVDAIDAALISMLAKRFAYMDAAARIKPDRNAVRDEARKAQVLDNVRHMANELSIPDAVIVLMWEELIEGSIAYEHSAWDKRQD
jgi:isochorismate pyruvate lyase